MYKPPKVDADKYQMTVTNTEFKGSKNKYSTSELKVYHTSRFRSNSEEVETIKFNKGSSSKHKI